MEAPDSENDLVVPIRVDFVEPAVGGGKQIPAKPTELEKSQTGTYS
jgi:hypothetical protein